ncbi:twin-arginine translocase subunit TatC [Halomarina litorea]|uniref:twin-arginine translocase subunit TatC n=1 Tax=Halomarina litorea TaxID=2961595 RepID=UPI0020C47C07|nr:twin-arginine translocase subunit TatC [Halomarina sp. BCD28]
MSDDTRREPDEDEAGSDADRESPETPDAGEGDETSTSPEATDPDHGDGADESGEAADIDADVDADTDTDTDADADADADADDDESGLPTEGSLPAWVQEDDVPGGDADDDERDGETPEREEQRDPTELDPDLADQGIDWDAMEEVDDDEDAAVAQSDGGATVSGGGFSDDFDDDFDGFEGPEGDQEMPLADHIEEMVRRLGIVIIAMSVVSVLVLPFSVDLINFIWYSILGNVQDVPNAPHVYRPLALVLARLKVATLAGFVVALPVFVFQTYLFMRPGLYQHERRYYLAAVPTSLVLAFIGVGFAFYLVLPALFSYFVSYTTGAADIAFGLTDTFGLMLLMMGFFAAVFQIPLLIMLAVMMGLTTRRWLVQRRLYFWGGFLGVALLFSPDPTGMAPIIVALTMVVLFEGTLLLLRWAGR